MLVEFAVENFKSFKNYITFSMLSTNKTGLPEHCMPLMSSEKGIQVNKLGILFCPNGSGKSNLLQALSLMITMVTQQGIARVTQENIVHPPFVPFHFSTASRTCPTLFQTIFEWKGLFFRYGFTYNASGIQKEWLYSGKPEDESLIFMRHDADSIEYGREAEKKLQAAREHLTPFSLLLTVGAELKVSVCQTAMEFFAANVSNLSSLSLGEMVEHAEFLPVFSTLLRFADIGIEQVESQEEQGRGEFPIPKEMPEDLRGAMEVLRKYAVEQHEKKAFFRHTTRDNTLDASDCVLPEDEESQGTRMFLRHIYRICLALRNDGIILCDELETGLHPLLVVGLLKFFTSVKNSRAQMICTSHCPVLFSREIVRRDELWIVEKDSAGQSFLQSISDFEGTQPGLNLTQTYLDGRFGGIPLLGNALLRQSIEAVENMLNMAQAKTAPKDMPAADTPKNSGRLKGKSHAN